MALASFKEAHSLVEFSLSPLYHYQYSSIHKVPAHLSELEGKSSDWKLPGDITRMCMSYYESSPSQDHLLLQTDTTPVCKPHSPTLKDRSHVAIPNNSVAGNKPLGIGYEVSLVNIADSQDSWSLPLLMKRVGFEETASDCAIKQLQDLLNHPELNLGDQLVVNTLDSKYGNAHYLAPVYQHQNLVNITRLRAGMKVYQRYLPEQSAADCGFKTGAPRVYGEKYYLHFQSQSRTYKHPKSGKPHEVFQRSILELDADDYRELSAQSSGGRELIIKLWRYNDMMIRSKDGNNMKDKPFDLLAIRIYDAHSGELVFDREMFIAISGQRKTQITTKAGYNDYRHRYDIEPYLRFCKQRLLLENYQTSNVAYFDNWLLILQLSSWLLYAASKEAEFIPYKWEKYLPKNKQAANAKRLSIAQTRKAAQRLFLTFEPDPFLPKKCKKGKGRQKGQTFTPKERYKVVKKSTKRGKSEPKQE
jgi:hypothetical protein